MDKYEYRLKLEQIRSLVDGKDYESAVKIADTINWKRIKNATSLCLFGEIYEKTGQYEKSRDIYLAAYDRSPVGRTIIFRLTVVALKRKDYEEAREFYEEFLEIAPHDNQRFILHYELERSRGAKPAELIPILKDLKEREFSEKWGFELALLYHKDGDVPACVALCDEIALWFGDGPYVEKALELKMLYAPLTAEQKDTYKRIKGGTLLADLDMQVVEKETAAPEENQPDVKSQPDAKSQSAPDHDAQENSSRPEAAEKIDTQEDAPLGQGLIMEEDGQIGLNVPPAKERIPQITGQLSIEDILAEWEKTKEAARAAIAEAEKRSRMRKSQEVQRETAAETGTGMSGESAAEAGAEKPDQTAAEAAVAALEESAKIAGTEAGKKDMTEKKEEVFEEYEIMKRLLEEQEQQKRKQQEMEAEEKPESEAASRKESEENEKLEAELRKETEPEAEAEKETESEVGKEAEPEEEPTKEAEPEEESAKEAELEEESAKEAEPEPEPESPPLVRFGEKQRRIFTYFALIDGMEQQLCQALEGAYRKRRGRKDSAAGNLAIIGSRGSGKSVLAADFIKAYQQRIGVSGGKVGKISADSLNNKDFDKVMEAVRGGYLIIERAGDLSYETIEKLAAWMEEENDGVLLVVEDDKKGIEGLLKRNFSFTRKITEHVRIPVFTSDELVAFARAYAEEQNCEIEDMGILALYNSISNIQKFDEATTLTEVKEIMDDAIYQARNGHLRKFLGRRKAVLDGRTLIREKDFE